MAFCFKCGYRISDNELFCPSCGASQSNEKKTLFDNIKGYKHLSSLDVKKGNAAILINVAGAILMVVAFIVGYFLFKDVYVPSLGETIVLLFALAALSFINILLKPAFLKLFGAGKISIHIGWVVDFNHEKPLSKTAFILSDVLALFLPLLPIYLFVPFGTFLFHYAATAIEVIMFLCNMPIYIYALTKPKGAMFLFDFGIIHCLVKENKE